MNEEVKTQESRFEKETNMKLDYLVLKIVELEKRIEEMKAKPSDEEK